MFINTEAETYSDTGMALNPFSYRAGLN